MANQILKTSGASRLSKQPIITGALRPSQKALLSAWQGHALPASAQRFMDMVRAGTQKTGRARELDKVTASQIPDRLAGQLAALSTPEGVRQYAGHLLLSAPQAGQTNLQALAQRAVLPEVKNQYQQVNQALQAAVVTQRPASLMQILSMLPPKIAQSILDERGAAITAFLQAWTEDIAMNAELDAKAAKKAAELAAQTQLSQRHASEISRANLILNMKKASQLQSSRKLDATSSDFAHKLLTQRQSVLKHTVVLATGGVVTSSIVEQSLNSSDRGVSFVAQLAPMLHVATLDALDMPEDDVGPKLGLKRGRPGIQG